MLISWCKQLFTTFAKGHTGSRCIAPLINKYYDPVHNIQQYQFDTQIDSIEFINDLDTIDHINIWLSKYDIPETYYSDKYLKCGYDDFLTNPRFFWYLGVCFIFMKLLMFIDILLNF